MAKMDDETLLQRLHDLEDDAAEFVGGTLQEERLTGVNEYFRKPYGTEQEGWSSIVTSDVQDTIEWILPDLLDIFMSSDKVVEFEPTKAEDVDGATQATQAVNYVFHKQNNGFLTLYTAIKDALMVKNCAVMWRKETRRVRSTKKIQQAPLEQIALEMEQFDDAEIVGHTEHPGQPIMGPMGPITDVFGTPMLGEPLYDVEISYVEQKESIKVEAFPPNHLLVQRDWSSPVLTDCGYVARIMPVTLSDIHEMGFTDVEASDLAASTDAATTQGNLNRGNLNRSDDLDRDKNEVNAEDESQSTGYLRIEFVLLDYDGDGIAERRCIYRLHDKVLSNDECAQVQIATASPILVPHRWDGMSYAEIISDLQQLRTELTRQVMNSAYLANNPRKKLLTDKQGNPQANIDDLLDSRPGGIMRQFQADAISDDVTPFVGGQMFPLLEYIDGMREQRSGVSRVQQGIDPNVLRANRTLGEAQMINQTAKQRIKLVARIFGEILLKPIFNGIFKLLTDGSMERIAFRLNDNFVEYDPNEWRDGYDMTVTVGLGTGDADQQLVKLQAIFQTQMGLMQSPFGPLMVTPQNVYNTQKKMVETAGFRNAGEFFTDPKGQMPQQPPPAPDPALQVEQMRQQGQAQKVQFEAQKEIELERVRAQAKLQEVQANLQLQAANDQRDAEREVLKAGYEAQQAARDDETKRVIADLNARLSDLTNQRDNETRRYVAEIQTKGRLIAGAQKAQQQPSESEA
jgi:hypothetical protein